MLTIFLSVFLAAAPINMATVKEKPSGQSKNQEETEYIFYVDDKRVDKETAKKIKLVDIKTITRYRDEAAIELYGPEAANGVVDIKTKNWNEIKQPIISGSSKISLEYVDLGLSVKWATCNIGADRPEDTGNYYSWGEIEPKRSYTWENYTHSNGSNKKLTKYCTDSSYGYNGFADNKTSLDPEDDVAHINLGDGWRIPTREEFEELMQNCTWTWTTQNDVNGYLVTSNKSGYTDRSIFLPVADGYSGLLPFYTGPRGEYWSSTVITDNPDYTFILYFDSGNVDVSAYNRKFSRSLRPVTP